jgi:hypothetical protein
MMDEQYLIWSNEHRCWWRANSAGYTRDVRAAGRYTRAEAIACSGGARNGWRDPKVLPDELAIRILDLPPAILNALLTDDVSAATERSDG